MYRKSASVLFLAALLCCLVLPASAVIQEVTLKGTVSAMNADKNLVTIQNPAQYGCNYPATGAPICSYIPMNISALPGTAPDPATFSIFKTGDPVIATSFGGAGQTWITLAKLFGSGDGQEYVTDIVGDAETVPAPLAGNYNLILVTNPDCAKCTGTVCTAGSASVAIQSDNRVVANKTLMPGENLFFNGRNDGSSVNVTFVKGEALPGSCQKSTVSIIGGAQPVSDYIVTVVPPIGMTSPSERSASPATIPVQTPKSASLPFAAIGASGLVAVLVAIRKG